MIACLPATGTVAETTLAYPPRTVLLLVAPWCAPCYGELSRLDEISAAARPYRVRVMLADDGRRAREMVRGIDRDQRWELTPENMRKARADILARTAGLPFSIVTDGDGRICAGQGGGLDAPRVRTLVNRCN